MLIEGRAGSETVDAQAVSVADPQRLVVGRVERERADVAVRAAVAHHVRREPRGGVANRRAIRVEVPQAQIAGTDPDARVGHGCDAEDEVVNALGGQRRLHVDGLLPLEVGPHVDAVLDVAGESAVRALLRVAQALGEFCRADEAVPHRRPAEEAPVEPRGPGHPAEPDVASGLDGDAAVVFGDPRPWAAIRVPRAAVEGWMRVLHHAGAALRAIAGRIAGVARVA